jgi:RNA polymerase sigma-70 factor, ECF subfamily
LDAQNGRSAPHVIPNLTGTKTGVEASLHAAYARSAAAHPDVVLAESTFVGYLADLRCDTEGAPGEGVPGDQALHAEDLYLCCAALAGNERAAAILRRALHPVIVRYVRCLDGGPDFVNEVEQRFWCTALLPAGGARPKLTSYSGRGPLANWVGISAQRLAYSLRRHGEAERRAADGQRLEIERLATDPELRFIKAHLRARYREAIGTALGTLDQHERLIYRMHLVDGVALERIGKIYGVSHSTISRRLAAARSRIVAEVRRSLVETTGPGAVEEDESLARFLDSDLELSLSRLLGRRSSS